MMTYGFKVWIVALAVTGLALGLVTVAFAASTNYAMARVVGLSAPSEDTTVTYPTINKAWLGGYGLTVAENNYQYTRKLALKFGTPDWNATWAAAQLMAAS